MHVQRSGWKPILSTMIFAATVPPLILAVAAVGASGLPLPNLVADPPENVTLESINDQAGKPRLLVRFDGFIHNRGPGALEVRGGERKGRVMKARQWVRGLDGVFKPVDPPSGIPLSLVYETADGHNHWHLKNAARYTLWNSSRRTVVATAGKVGFCLEDNEAASGSGNVDPRYTNDSNRFCHKGKPNVPRITEGISPGWRDVYARNLPFQWVDASDVAPGRYWLGAEVDPKHSIRESNPNNPVAFASAPVVIDGYTAQSATFADLVTDAPSPVLLDADVAGVPGPRAFRIIAPPAHGHLDARTGERRTDPVVTYTPDDKFRGTDHFTYVALDATSPFPLHPQIATVTLRVGTTYIAE